jgi:hypothetical protein
VQSAFVFPEVTVHSSVPPRRIRICETEKRFLWASA